VAVLLATLWWVVPLLALSRFSPPFLDFIESASITTRTATLVESLRGTGDWVAYLGDASTRAGTLLLTRPALIAGTVVVSAVGLAGIVLAHRRVRGWLALLLVTGVVLTTLGYVGTVDSPLSAIFRELLDGALAPLRNTHKFDVLLRLALTLGLAVAIEVLSRGRSRAESVLLRGVVTAAAAFAVLASASPFLALATAPRASWTAVPAYWSQAAEWLAEHDPHGRTLLAPGSRFADYEWGSTGDEPLQALADSGWDVRNAVPLTGAGHIRWLDEVERLLADGRGGANLASALSDGGITHVLVRNDLNLGASAATRPLLAGAALAATPGVQRVASFGPVVGGSQPGPVVVDDGLRLASRAIDVYVVDGNGDPRVIATPLSAVSRVSGSAEALHGPGLDGAPVGVSTLDPSSATIDSGSGPRVLTDTPRRRETNFGTGAFGSSQTLTADDPLRLDKPVLDYASWPESDAAVAVLSGVESLGASSSASDADAYPRSDPGAMPYAAVDGDPATSWHPNPSLPARGAWWQVVLPTPRDLSGTVLVDGAGLGGLTSLRLTTDVGSTVLPVVGDEVDLPPVRTSRVRLTLDGVPDRPSIAVGIREVAIPGIVVRRSVVVPPARPVGTVPDRVWLRSDPGEGGCVTVATRPVCAPALSAGGEDGAGLDRTLTLPAGSFRATVSAVPRAGGALDDAVEGAMGLPFDVAASSRGVGDPAAGPWAAVDGALDTAWLADGRDPTPSLTLTWRRPVRVDELTVRLDAYAAGTTPTGVEITSPRGARKALLDPTGRASFDALTTDRLTVRFVANPYVMSIDPYSLARRPLGVAVSELELPGVTGPVSVSGAGDDRAVVFPCGSGPVLDLGRERVETSVSTTLSSLLRGREVTATVCGDNALRLGGGIVRVAEEGGPDRAWAVTQLVLDRGRAPSAGTTTRGPVVSVTSWTAGRRSLDLAAHTEPVVLTIRENENPGWRATLNGSALEPVTVNGWQQGFVVPAGEAGDVTLRFAGDDASRTGMLVGAITGALLILGGAVVALAGLRGRRAQPPNPHGPPLGPAPDGVVAGALASLLVLLGGAWTAPAAVGVVGAVLLARRLPASRLPRAQAAAWVAAVAYLAAGAVLMTGPLGSADYRAGATVTQLLALLAVTAVVVGVMPARWWARRAS
jgi:arabinofuranan 3-O-arabinosyltransferase